MILLSALRIELCSQIFRGQSRRKSAKLSCTVQIHISGERTLSNIVISSLQVTLRCAVFSSVASASLDRRWGKIVRVSIQNLFLKRQSVKFTAMKGQFFGGKYSAATKWNGYLAEKRMCSTVYASCRSEMGIVKKRIFLKLGIRSYDHILLQ